jgi:hypothetical protein
MVRSADNRGGRAEIDFWLIQPHTGGMSASPGSNPPGGPPRLPAIPKSRRKAEKKEPEAVDTTGRRTWVGYVLWGVIAVLGLAAATELRAQMGFRKALSTCQSAIEKMAERKAEGKRVLFDEIKVNLPSNPVYTNEVHSFTPSGVYTWSWQGLRRYKVRLIVSPKDGTIWDVKSEP